MTMFPYWLISSFIGGAVEAEAIWRSCRGIFLSSFWCEIRHGQKKAESTKTPRYIDTRVDDVFPVKKFNDLLRIHSEKQKASTSGSHSGQKCSESTFRSVAELSRGSEASGNPLDFDMDKALKGLGTYNLFTVFPMIANSTGIFGGFLIITLFENCLS
ncbi:hypothetical protein AMTR_s00083p00036180 [Amborella trichopoda]|uniref:Amino acid transporter transmembrane domain-containing protein n=1 Tax=Amborella trichopoda TaxID=13333 RepID=W1P699_AMBTC|nr:hypothetical protein AMTR_s00083p00036180 [Amborella trichopoda]